MLVGAWMLLACASMSAMWTRCARASIRRVCLFEPRHTLPMSPGLRGKHLFNRLSNRESIRLYASVSTGMSSDNIDGKRKKKKLVPIAQLTEAMAREELIELNGEINKHDTLYYDENSPEITDSAYDKLIIRMEGITGKYLQLKSLIDKNARIGSGKSSNKLLPFAHTRPMLSLENAFTKENVFNFIIKMNEVYNTYERNSPEEHKRIEMVVEPKVDGLSCSLHYHNGILTKAGTRGDGIVGEDVTENIMALTNIPKSLIFDDRVPEFVEIRGEVYISKEDFRSINQEKADAGEQLLSTSRNAAAGFLRRTNNTILAKKSLKFCAYYMSVNGNDRRTQAKDLIALKDLGFDIPEPYYVSSDAKDLINYLSQVESMRSNIRYDIDGCVLKVSDQLTQTIIGERSKDPKWAIAYKFNAIEAITTLLSIDIQVGRTGLLTPVANIEPVQVGGVVINRATLHNEDEINRLGLMTGKKVKVKRAGDVIPKIVGLAEEISPDSTGDEAVKFFLPSNCPVCNSVVEKDVDSILSRCSGGPLVCSAQAIEGLVHFCSRDAMDIEGLGPAKIEELYNLGVIKTPLDIFRLRSVDLSSTILRERKGWGDKSVNNLLSAIDSRRQGISFSRFLYALGIRHVGAETAKDISNEFQSFQLFWDYLKEVTDTTAASRLLVIKGIGKKAINSLLKIINDSRSRDVIEGLMGSITISDNTNSVTEISSVGYDSRFPLRGQHIVMTGKFTDKIKLSRSQLYSIVEEYGATTSSAVTKSTTILVAAGSDESESKKIKSAREMRIKIFNEDDLLQYFTANNIKLYLLCLAVFGNYRRVFI